MAEYRIAVRYAIRTNFAKRINVNTCVDPMTYPENVHIQAIDVWTYVSD